MSKHNALDHFPKWVKQNKKTIIITASSATIAIVIIAGGIFAYQKTYEGRVYPNVSIDGMPVGGLTQSELNEVLQSKHQNLIDSGLWLNLEGEEAHIDLSASNADDADFSYNLIDLDTDQLSNNAISLGRSGNWTTNMLTSLYMAIAPTKLDPNFIILNDQLEDSIRETFSDLESPGEPTDYKIVLNDPVEISVTEGVEGTVIDIEDALNDIEDDLADFDLGTIELKMIDSDKLVTRAEAESLVDNIKLAIAEAPYKLTHTTESQRYYAWYATGANLADWLIPARNADCEVELSLAGDAFDAWLETIGDDVNIEPQNALFSIEGSRVVEFQPSFDGVTLDKETTIKNLVAILGQEDSELAIAVETVDPTVSTDSVNDLGITEILGVGTSDFSGSPSNRIANIKNGASKLNGMLIPPGETVSLITALKPFTYENGYLSELVIKGDEIKAEMGGGLCQIGTTTFRAVMNAGLEVVERRNHSLVVSYYNDPANNNPGTDATIYEPSPDFKFRNDTENYILFSTYVDTTNMMLYFTFWGTSDGRSGYYTAPAILSWTGYGEPVEIETLDLEPGKKECQYAHPGATASFDYIVEYADGTVFEHTYTSVYRSLPMMCLVGVEELSSGEECEDCSEDDEEVNEDTEGVNEEDEEVND
ncbi:MAG: VanW family protein [bacterium]